VCRSPVATGWTQGFFPGELWLLVERKRLLQDSVPYSEEELVNLARRWQEPIKTVAYPAINHDQVNASEPWTLALDSERC
jgi:hypothetical protein